MKQNPFDSLADEYEEWFIENKVLFQTELLALKKVIPVNKKGVEIGIGSGIFAEQLGIRFGIDPSEKMLNYARQRGLEVQQGIAEKLPYQDQSFDFAALITSLCFVDDPDRAIKEAYRILNKKGELIVAILDKETTLGKVLDAGKEKDPFYKFAHFFSTQEIINLMKFNDFRITQTVQTIEDPAAKKIENPRDGFGEGSFVVIKGIKV